MSLILAIFMIVCCYFFYIQGIMMAQRMMAQEAVHETPSAKFWREEFNKAHNEIEGLKIMLEREREKQQEHYEEVRKLVLKDLKKNKEFPVKIGFEGETPSIATFDFDRVYYRYGQKPSRIVI